MAGVVLHEIAKNLSGAIADLSDEGFGNVGAGLP